MIKLSLITLSLLLVVTMSVEIKQGKIYLTHKQLSQADQKMSININSESSNTLKLSQDSKIKLEVQIQFSQANFIPEVFTFRLKHTLHNNLTEPVLASYNQQTQKFTANLDLGNPKQIKPYSGTYHLQIVISDDRLTNNMRKNLVACNVEFRAALSTVPRSELAYSTDKLILTTPPPQRVDPPQQFTVFVTLLLVIVFVMFIAALKYLGVNAGLFPAESTGIIWNILFIGILVGMNYILVKFWLSWNFISTLKYLLILIPPSILVANYAFVHLKKRT